LLLNMSFSIMHNHQRLIGLSHFQGFLVGSLTAGKDEARPLRAHTPHRPAVWVRDDMQIMITVVMFSAPGTVISPFFSLGGSNGNRPALFIPIFKQRIGNFNGFVARRFL